MKVDKFDDLKMYQFAIWTKQIANKAVHRTLEENRKYGLPNVFFKNGVTYYEINGKISTKNPVKMKKQVGQ